MAIKLILLAASIAVARGGVIGAPIAAPALLAQVSDATVDPNPAYSFAYDVQDTLTGDSKSQVESRANGIVKGQYTVADPDGTRRIVDYYADPVHGFNAVVRRAPLTVAAPVAVPAPVVAPAPLVTKAVTAPLLAAPAPFGAAPGLARIAAPYAVAPGLTRLAAPYVAAPPAPLAVAPGIARVAAPFAAGPATLPYAAAPYAF